MNFKDLINKKTIHTIQIQAQGGFYDFYVKPLTGGAKNDLLADAMELQKLHQKVNEAKEAGESYTPTGSELVSSIVYRQNQAFYCLCDKDGSPAFKDFETFINSFDSDTLEQICTKVEKTLSTESPEEIEKN